MSESPPVVVTPATLRDWPLPLPTEGKESRGQVLVAGGTLRSAGALLLAGEAALRAGGGKLVLATVATHASALEVAVPESAVLALPTTPAGNIADAAASELVEQAGSSAAFLVGPGFMHPDESASLLEGTMPGVRVPVVVDAVASAYLTQHPDGLHHLEGRAVLTVNPTELARTAGRDLEDVADDPIRFACHVARRRRVVVLCGGTRKVVATPDGRSWVIEGGGPGLGVSGSGDVQAGIVAGLLARGAEPAQAAVWAGLVHARCGERLSSSLGAVGYLARELLPEVPRVLTELD